MANREDAFLGMDRPITRRDFLQGAAIGIAGMSSACRRDPAPADHSQPALNPDPHEISGLRGQDPASMKLGHMIRDSAFQQPLASAADTGESYDLVVVGAGLSGLAAAHVYHREKKGRCRILILENNDDFGGHARRNTFHHAGSTLIVHGGTFELEDLEDSPSESMEILTGLNITAERLSAYRDENWRPEYGLSSGVYFDPRIYASTSSPWVNRFYDIPHEQFFDRAPISPDARKELIELYTTRKRYLKGVDDPEEALEKMSWEEFIRNEMKLGDEAVRFANLYSTDLIGLGCDGVSALAGYEVGPGFFGMAGPGFIEKNGVLRYAYDFSPRFPDGNHNIARCLLKSILPAAVPGSSEPESVFNSRVRYDLLDRKESDVRLRLKSAAIRIEHENRDRVVVHYASSDGRLHRVRARSCVVAAWGMVAKHIVPELSEHQKAALNQYRYTSALYINVMLRNWQPIAKLGLFEMYLPGGFCTWMHVSDPLRVGNYSPPYDPDSPTVLSIYKYLHKPGLTPDQQMIHGRVELETTSFETHEKEVRSELQRMFGSQGFHAATDILAMTINRWGHGYNFFHKPRLPGEGASKPYEAGRARFGRISFAGADAGGLAWTQTALQQGHRAAYEQL